MKELKNKKQAPKLAAAIKYDRFQDGAPRVSARGRGALAERIIEIAEENGIPLKNDPELVQILSKLKVDSEIPIELYRAVAEILAFVYSLNDGQKPINIPENK